MYNFQKQENNNKANEYHITTLQKKISITSCLKENGTDIKEHKTYEPHTQHGYHGIMCSIETTSASQFQV
jgi:hypothetical protein